MSTESTIKRRDPYWDILKGIAIIMVVSGHCIQVYSGTEYLNSGQFWENPIFKFIYSFHMPLFMTICGFFFWKSSHKRSFGNLISNKVQSIIIPIASFSLFSFLVYRQDAWLEHSIIEAFKGYYHWFRICLWFLWTLLQLSIIVAIVQKFLKDKWYVYLVIFLATFIIPDDCFGVMSDLDKYMYPYFILGYYISKQNWIELLFKYQAYLLPASLSAFCVGLYFWNNETFIYTTGVTLLNTSSPLHQMLIDSHRLITGMGGVLAAFIIVKKLSELQVFNQTNRVIAFIGVYSLGIYGVHQYVLPTTYFTNALSGPSILGTTVEIIALVILSTIVTWGISKWKVTNYLFLGGR